MYSDAELEQDWEFKIVRSATGAFRNPATLRAVVEEEARAGWRLLEKFDDGRLRFKRPASARQGDGMLPRGMDPYRTCYGHSEAFVGIAIVLAVMLSLLVVGAAASLLQAGAP